MRTFLIVVALLGLTASTHAAKNKYLTSGLSRGRALAMGSAYHSVMDDLSSGLYNPAAFRVGRSGGERRVRLFFNPAGMAASLNDFSRYDQDYAVDDELTAEEGFRSCALFIKGAALSTPLFDLGINLGEEIIGEDILRNRKRFYSIEGFNRGSFNTAFLNFKIAQSVSLGIAGTLYSSRIEGQTTHMGGYTFGILMNPNPKLNVGIAYNEIPEKFSRARFVLESIEGGTVSSGISYQPGKNTVVSIDLRNLNKEDKHASREIHTGIERIFRDRIALRAGYYRKKLTDNDVYSFGIGILPIWEKVSTNMNSSRSDILTYSLISEENGYKCRWHVFSLLLRY